MARPKKKTTTPKKKTTRKKGKGKTKTNTKKPPFFLWLAKWTLILGVWALFLFGVFALWFGYDLPSVSHLTDTQRRPSITIYAKDGRTRLATYGDLHGTVVKVEELPPHMINALLAIEDRRFYYHFGVDPIGLARAAYVNSQAGRVVQGGSTLTQQLAKNFLMSQKMYEVNDRSFRRKVQEALMALWLEYKFTKNQILTMYLNRVYFGSGTFGLDAAARHYFGKPAKQVTLYESAVLAGLLKAPTRYSPASNPEQADSRARQVLEAMVDADFIRHDDKEAALLMASSPPESPTGSSVRYFADWVIDQLQDYVGLEDTDLLITTTLDPRLQKAAEDEATALMENHGDKYNCSQLALVSMSPDGAVRAMIGGVEYRKSQFNRVTQALRQSSSTFKLFVYLAALELGYKPHSLISDRTVRMGKWRPQNFKYKSRGDIPVLEAFAYSVNTATVRLAKEVSTKVVSDMANRLGLMTPQPEDMSMALGTGDATLLELTTAYGVLPNHGYSVYPYGILSIRNSKGEEIYKRHPGGHTKILDRETVQAMTRMLEAVVKQGTGRNAAINHPAGGKTGTSQKDRDALFVGFTPTLVTGVWAGNDKNESMRPQQGGSMATRLWKAYMTEALKSKYPQALDTGASETSKKSSDKNSLNKLIQGIFG